MANAWFRFYSESLRDRKLERCARVTGNPKALLLGVWATVLCLANDSPVPGVLLLTEEIPLVFDDLCMETGLDAADLDPILSAFGRMQMLEVDEAGAYVVTHWTDRQFKSDSSAERVRRYRERQEAEEPEESNDGVTLQDRSGNAPEQNRTEQKQNRTENQIDGADAPGAGHRSERDAIRSSLEDHFSTVTGIPKPDTGNDKARRSAGTRWWSPLRSLAELCEWDVDTSRRLIDSVVAYMRAHSLTITAPKSILNVATAAYTGNAPDVGFKREPDTKPQKRTVRVIDHDTGQVVEREAIA